MMYRVYQIINAETRKVYIGMTKSSLELRFKQHWKSSAKELDRSYLHFSMKKHGRDAFSIHLIHECKTRELAAELERFLIEECDCRYPNGYNLRTGGDGGYQWHEISKRRARENTTSYMKQNPEAIERLRKVAKEQWTVPGYRESASRWAKEYAKTEMGLARARKAQSASAQVKREKREIALRNGTATRCQIAAELRAYVNSMPAEWRKARTSKRLSEGGCGKYVRTPETLAKLSASKIGRPHGVRIAA